MEIANSQEIQETLRIIQNTINEYSNYNKIPFVRSGLIICDEEHFKGWKLSPTFLKSPCPMYLNIKKNNQNRGISGFLRTKEENLAEALIKVSKGAAFQDPNFPQIQPEELENLSYTLYLLSNIPSLELTKDEILKFMDTPKSFENKTFAIQAGYRTCIILPNQDAKEKLRECEITKEDEISITTYETQIIEF